MLSSKNNKIRALHLLEGDIMNNNQHNERPMQDIIPWKVLVNADFYVEN